LRCTLCCAYCNLVRSSITPKTLSADALADIREFSIKLQRFLVVTKTSSLKGPNKTSWPSELEFYAGAKLKRANGEIFGTLCIWDYTPQELSELQIESLKLCAQFAAQKIELTRLLSHPRNKCELLNTHNSGPATTNYRKNLGKLTPREKEIMYLILDHTGESSNKDIARHLGISHRTVELHRLRVFALGHEFRDLSPSYLYLIALELAISKRVTQG